MKVIITKNLSTTHTKGNRVKATFPATGDSVTISEGALELAGIDTTFGDKAHEYAAHELAKKLRLPGIWAMGDTGRAERMHVQISHTWSYVL